MTPLRQQMIDAMQLRGLSIRTHESYLYAVTAMARYFNRSPDQLRAEQIQEYFVYLVKERGVSAATCRLYLNGIRFLYLRVLNWQQFNIPIQYPKRVQKIPELLTRAEIRKLILACNNAKHRIMLLTCYGCGLRVSELVALKVQHVDGERQLLRVEQGKGAKDRLVVLPLTLLQQLRLYWREYRPRLWLFPNANTPRLPLGVTSIQKRYRAAKKKCGIQKVGGIHSLRHAYATHQLEQGIAIHKLQHQLGHRHLQTTLRYVHWVPTYQQGGIGFSDLVGQLGEELDHG